MATLAKLKKLKKIRLSLCHKVSASDVQPLMQLKNLESISLQKGRDFKGTTLVSEETMKAFGRFPALKKFDITTEIVTQKGLRILFEAKPGIELVEKITRSKWKRWKRE